MYFNSDENAGLGDLQPHREITRRCEKRKQQKDKEGEEKLPLLNSDGICHLKIPSLAILHVIRTASSWLQVIAQNHSSPLSTRHIRTHYKRLDSPQCVALSKASIRLDRQRLLSGGRSDHTGRASLVVAVRSIHSTPSRSDYSVDL